MYTIVLYMKCVLSNAHMTVLLLRLQRRLKHNLSSSSSDAAYIPAALYMHWSCCKMRRSIGIVCTHDGKPVPDIIRSVCIVLLCCTCTRHVNLTVYANVHYTLTHTRTHTI